MIAPYTPTPEPNTLETALAGLIADPAKGQAVFEHALLFEVVYVVPTDGVPPEGEILGVDRPFRLDGVTLGDGQQPTALFTSPEKAKAAFGPETPVMGMRGLHALEIMEANGVILNPGAPPGLVLDPAQIQAITRDVVDARFSVGDVTLSAPEREPTNLVARLTKALATPEVSGAWLARAVWADERPGGWYLDVRGATGLADIRRRVTASIIGLDFHGETMELSVGPERDGNGVGIRLV